MEWHRYPTAELDQWKEYYDRLETGGPYHAPTYVEVLTGYLEDEQSAELFILEDDDAFVYYPVLVRSLETVSFADGTDHPLSEHRDLVSSWYYGGPLVSGDGADQLVSEFSRAFGEFCDETGVVSEFIRFDPNLKNHETFENLDPVFNRETVRVDLTQSFEAIWNGFEKRNRNAIRQAKGTSIEVAPTNDSAEFEAFYGIYSDAMEAKDATEHYRFPFSFFEELLRTDLVSLLVARLGDEVIGGSMVAHDGHIAHDYLRASDPAYWDMRVNNLLCYAALLEMRERGHAVFDFQGGRPGVFRFKKGFSPDREEFYHGTRVHDRDLYDRLVAAADEAGINTDAGYFPAYRVERSN